MEWLRWYHGCVTDPKFALVSRRSGQAVASVLAVWAALLERASQGRARGSVSGFDCESFDVLLGLDDGACRSIVSAFESKGMIVDEMVAKWDERQSKDEESAERKRLQREREKLAQERAELEALKSTLHCESPRDVTDCHDMSRDVTDCLQMSLRGDKRRVEEIKEKDVGGRGGAGGDSADPLPDAGASSPPPKNEKKYGSRFVAPTAQQVAEYCQQRSNTVDPQRFVDYYTANGWRVGKNPMRDWQAAVRTWERDINGVGNGAIAESTAPANQDELVRRVKAARAERERKAQEAKENAAAAR